MNIEKFKKYIKDIFLEEGTDITNEEDLKDIEVRVDWYVSRDYDKLKVGYHGFDICVFSKDYYYDEIDYEVIEFLLENELLRYLDIDWNNTDTHHYEVNLKGLIELL